MTGRSGLRRQNVVVFAAAGAMAFGACSAPSTTEQPSSLSVETFEVLDAVLVDADTVEAVIAGTIDGPAYSSDPPTSGARTGDFARCGIYRQSIPDLYQVASLAQGSVVVQYQSSFTADARGAVEAAARAIGAGVIVAPRDGLESPVVVTAWGVMMRLPWGDVERIVEFVSQYGGSGPSAQECPMTVNES
jgi:hypothetical protein